MVNLNKQVLVAVFCPPSGIRIICPHCNKAVREGEYALIIQIGKVGYLLGNNTPVQTCCGKSKNVPQMFPDEGSAIAMQEDVVRTVSLEKSTASFHLIEFPELATKNLTMN